jgi:hypothetical protein
VASSQIFRRQSFSMVVVTWPKCCRSSWIFHAGVALVRGQFPLFRGLSIQIIWLIERVLSPYAMSTNGLKSFQLFSALTSALMKSWTSVIVLTGGGGGDRRAGFGGTDSKTADWTG